MDENYFILKIQITSRGNAMITIVAKNIIKPGKNKEFIRLAEELVQASRIESGCIKYALYEDTQNPSILTFLEIWESDDAIKKHNASNHFTEIVPKLIECCDSSSSVNLYREIY